FLEHAQAFAEALRWLYRFQLLALVFVHAFPSAPRDQLGSYPSQSSPGRAYIQAVFRLLPKTQRPLRRFQGLRQLSLAKACFAQETKGLGQRGRVRSRGLRNDGSQHGLGRPELAESKQRPTQIVEVNRLTVPVPDLAHHAQRFLVQLR